MCSGSVFGAVEAMDRHRGLQAELVARFFAEADNQGRALGINAVSEVRAEIVRAWEPAVARFKEAMVACIGDADEQVRDEALDSLRRLLERRPREPVGVWIIDEPEHINALRGYLYDLDMGVQLAGARALAQLGVDEPVVVDVALTCIDVTDAHVRVRAADVLRRLPRAEDGVAERLVGILYDQREWDAPVQGIASERICTTNVWPTPVLEVVAAAFRVHGVVDADLAAFVLRQCRHDEREARRIAVGVLRELGLISGRAAWALEQVLLDEEAGVVEQGWPMLERLLESGEDEGTRMRAYGLCNRGHGALRELGSASFSSFPWQDW